MLFKTQFPDKPDMGSYEAFTKPSMTEPDNTMSIPEIIARYTRGQGLGVEAYPWATGVAQEEGEAGLQDATAEQVLGLQSEPAGSEPTPPAAGPVEPAPAAAPAPAPEPPAPAGAPGAGAQMRAANT